MTIKIERQYKETAAMKNALLLTLIAALLLTGCSAGPAAPTPVLPGSMETCEYELMLKDQLDAAVKTIEAALTEHNSKPAALDADIEALLAVQERIAVDVPDSAKLLRRDSLLFVGQAITLAKWMREDGGESIVRPRFTMTFDRMIQDMTDLQKDLVAMHNFCLATE